MPIRWSALQVMEATDVIEKHINAAMEPLECAREATKSALEIPNLPQYIDSRLRSLWGEIDRAIGTGSDRRGSMLKSRLKAIRDDVPAEALGVEKKDKAYGERLSLI